MRLRSIPILRRQFWTSYRIALVRSRTDRRARAAAIRTTLFLLCVVYVAAYCVFLYFALTSEGIQGLIFYGLLSGAAMIAFFAFRRAGRREERRLSFSITGSERPSIQAAEADISIKTYLAERAIIISSLLARAASEVRIQRNGSSADNEDRTRIGVNTLLRERGLWEKLESVEAQLFGLAPGSWDVEQVNEVALAFEQIRLLRWVFRLDPELIPLAHFPKPDFELIRQILENPQVVFGATDILHSWDVRIERNIAYKYAARVLAEMKARSLLVGEAGVGDWADRFRADTLGSSKDYLAGPITIAEMDENALRMLGATASARERYAAYLVQQLSSRVSIPFSAFVAGDMDNNAIEG